MEVVGKLVTRRMAAIAVFAVMLAACSNGASPSATATSTAAGGGGGGTNVDVTLTEFKVTFGTTEIPAGDVTFNVKNDGTVVHEFVVFKTDDAEDALPTDDEGTEVDEDDSSLQSMGEVEDVDPGSSKSFSATLEPGDYVGICNVPGHYGSGMHIHFTVS